MRVKLSWFALAACLFLAPAAIAPALAQTDANFEISLGYFASRLEPFGHWINHPVWGDVWQPDAGRKFRPYFYGYWEYTSDAGWMWVSNEPYGDIVYHYGRWIYDPANGWLWVPGYVWAPSWVVWREGEDYIGWLPMPPTYSDITFDQTPGPSYAPEVSYGYEYFYGGNFTADLFANLWVFAQVADFGRSDRRRYIVDHDKLRDLLRRSRDHTHYVTEHDHVIDRSIDPHLVETLGNRTIAGNLASRFLHRNTPMETVSGGREIFRNGREAEQARLNASPPGLGAIAGQNSPGLGEVRRNRAFGDGRNPVAGSRSAPLEASPALAPSVSGTGMPPLFRELPGSRMHVVRGIGPSTDGLAPSVPNAPAFSAGPRPAVPAIGLSAPRGPQAMGPVTPLAVPHVARVPVAGQPSALALPQAPGPAIAPVIAPSVPVPAVSAPAVAPTAAPAAPQSAPHGLFRGRGP
jgi:hypothetical protein